MATTSQIIQQAAEQIQTGNAADLKQALQRVAAIPAQQLAANQTSITYPLQMMVQAADRNIKVNAENMVPGMGIKKLLQQTTSNLPPRLKRQMQTTMKQLQKQTTAAEKQALEQKISQLSKDVISDAVMKKAMKQSSQTIIKVEKTKFAPTSMMTPIQLQMQPYRSLIDNVSLPSITKPSQVPEAVKLLARYASTQNMRGISSATNYGGLSYVGVKQISDMDSGSNVLIPYNEQVQSYGSGVPSISVQLKHRAHKTMSTWNGYVDAQSKFVKFLSKINSSADRASFVEKQFRTLNTETICGQCIASVAYYYVFVPMQKMLIQMGYNSDIKSTYESFKTYYEVGSTPQTNPLLLSTVKALLVVQSIFTQDQPPSILWATLKKVVQGVANSINKNQIATLLQYGQKRVNEAKQFMNQNGMGIELMNQIILSKDWTSIKKKKILINRGNANTQTIGIARKILSEQKDDSALKKMKYYWNMEQIWAYDYVWKKQ